MLVKHNRIFTELYLGALWTFFKKSGFLNNQILNTVSSLNNLYACVLEAAWIIEVMEWVEMPFGWPDFLKKVDRAPKYYSVKKLAFSTNI